MGMLSRSPALHHTRLAWTASCWEFKGQGNGVEQECTELIATRVGIRRPTYLFMMTLCLVFYRAVTSVGWT